MFFFFASRTATKQSFKSTVREKNTASLSYQSQCEYLLRNIIINSRTYARIHTPTVVQGGWGGWWNPRVADVLQYFEKILPSMESLWSFQQDEVFFVGGGATGGLWRHKQWSPSFAAQLTSFSHIAKFFQIWSTVVGDDDFCVGF